MTRIITGGLGGPLVITQGYGLGAHRGCVAVRDWARYTVEGKDFSCGMGNSRVGYKIHEYGSLVRVSTDQSAESHPFRDEDTGENIDPDVVNLTIITPAGLATTYVYNTDAEVGRLGVGDYYGDIDVNQAGIWRYRWWSTGNGQASQWKQFVVRPTYP